MLTYKQDRALNKHACQFIMYKAMFTASFYITAKMENNSNIHK